MNTGRLDGCLLASAASAERFFETTTLIERLGAKSHLPKQPSHVIGRET
jgi:hypothetical protein